MSTFASSDKAKYWSERNTIQPHQISLKSGKKFWFDCPVCLHDFESILFTIARGSWCPYCVNRKLCLNPNCNYCYNLSFASSDKARRWSTKNIITPREVFKSSHKKFWFDCPNCFHEFDSTLNHITIGGRWCPYCASKQLCSDLDCDICKELSFASLNKAQYWSTKNTVTPREVFKSSQYKYWFTCNICNHDFDTALSGITCGFWCPYCTHQKLCPITIDCDYCYNLSFASSYRARYWSKKNTVSPQEVFKSSHCKYWFDCEVCNNDFETTLGSITNMDSWCPNCVNKTEKMVFMFLKTIDQYKITTQYKFNYENIRTFPFDFLVEYNDKKCIIEVDGDQHFITKKEHYASQMTNQERTERDILKMKGIIHECVVIRLVQDDIYRNIYDWKKFIIDTVDISEVGKVYIHDCNSDIYETHLIDFEYEILPTSKILQGIIDDTITLLNILNVTFIFFENH